ncbi:MAG: hypothetical protein C0392_13895 [Syntrophus sp. (in: bacteria)]|nr:hypothetical protein [Syntrophus sp. (in: bacteria)]
MFAHIGLSPYARLPVIKRIKHCAAPYQKPSRNSVDRVILNPDNIDRRIGNPFKTVLPYNKINLNPYCALIGKNKFGLNGKDHPFFQDDVMSRGNNRQLINLKAEPVPYEADLAFTVTHKIVLKSCLFYSIHCPVEKFCAINAFPAIRLHVLNNLPGNVITLLKMPVQIPRSKHPRLIGNVTVIPATVINEEGITLLHPVDRWPLGYGMGHAHPCDRHIGGGRVYAGMAVGNIDIHHFLVKPPHPEESLMPVEPALCLKGRGYINFPYPLLYYVSRLRKDLGGNIP